MRPLLILAHAFPPVGGAGVQRVAKFVKYLPRHGWQPTVIAGPLAAYAQRDDDLARDVPQGVHVVRTRSLELPAHAVGELRPAQGRVQGAPAARRSALLRPSVREGLRAAAYGLYRTVAIPDRHVGWVPFAVAAGLWLARRRRFAAVLATGNPFSSFIAARLLAERLQCALVLDYRDAWTLNPYRRDRGSLRWHAEARLEGWVLAGASGALFATGPMREDYARAFPAHTERFVVLPNGYDPDDFAGAPARPQPPLTIVYAGKFTPYRRPDAVLRALALLRAARPDLAADVRLLFVGDVDEAGRALAAELGLAGCVRWLGYRPHREALGYLRGGQALLLVGGGHRSEQTTKVFEYVAAARPILALVPADGAAGEVVRASPGGGYFAWPPAPALVAAQLVRLLEHRRHGVVPAGLDGAAEQYARPHLVGVLAEHLDHWCGRSDRATAEDGHERS